MGKKLVSVIMSVYNEEEGWLRQSIESILNQTYPYLEFLIIIDNPENHQLTKVVNEYAEKDKRIIMIKNEKNLGLVASLNKALGIASGTYVARMDADEISLSNRIEKELKVILQKNVDFLSTSYQLINRNGKIISKNNIGNISSKDFNELMKCGNISMHTTWFLKKEVYDKLNGYRDIRYCEDFDFILRAIQNGYRCYRMDDILINSRIREDGISLSHALEQYLAVKFLKNIYRNGYKLDKYAPEFINNKCANFTNETKMKYRNANAEKQLLRSAFKEKKMLSCIVIVLKNYFTNSYFREDFNDYAKCCLMQKKVMMFEKIRK